MIALPDPERQAPTTRTRRNPALRAIPKPEQLADASGGRRCLDCDLHYHRILRSCPACGSERAIFTTPIARRWSGESVLALVATAQSLALLLALWGRPGALLGLALVLVPSLCWLGAFDPDRFRRAGVAAAALLPPLMGWSWAHDRHHLLWSLAGAGALLLLLLAASERLRWLWRVTLGIALAATTAVIVLAASAWMGRSARWWPDRPPMVEQIVIGPRGQAPQPPPADAGPGAPRTR